MVFDKSALSMYTELVRVIYLSVDRVIFRLTYYFKYIKDVLILFWIYRYCGGEVPM